jgi:hypothetical protein
MATHTLFWGTRGRGVESRHSDHPASMLRGRPLAIPLLPHMRVTSTVLPNRRLNETSPSGFVFCDSMVGGRSAEEWGA